MKRLTMICLLAACIDVAGCTDSPSSNSVCSAEKARIAASGSQSDRLPLGLAKIPGSKMRGPVILDGSRMGSGVSISTEMEVPGTLRDISAFYEDEFKRTNAKIERPEFYNDLTLLHGPTADGGYLMIGIDVREGSGIPKGSAKVDIHYQVDCL
jgi:hypothetical protein